MSVTISGDGTITGLDADGISSQPVFPGNVLQVVSTTKTDTFSTASTSLVDVTGLSVSITPSSATSKILVMVVASGGGLEGANGMNLALLRGATQIALGDASGSRSRGFGGNQQITNEMNTNTAIYLDSPATTSATTYKVQASVNTGTGYINRTHNDADNAYTTRGVSSITVMEIAA
jgi:hypothetical protein